MWGGLDRLRAVGAAVDPLVGAALVLSIAGIVGVAVWFPRRRSFLRLLPGMALILVPVILVVVAVIQVVGSAGTLDVPVRQAAIAAFVIAAGWVVSFLLQEFRRASERDEKIRDVHRAIFADISSFLQGVGDVDQLRRDGEALAQRIASEPDFFPFLPTPHRSSIFAAQAGDMSVLPRLTIDLIVYFYAQLDTMAGFVDDLKSERFMRLDRSRQVPAFEDYMRMAVAAVELGSAARRIIDIYDNEGPRRAHAAVVALNAARN